VAKYQHLSHFVVSGAGQKNRVAEIAKYPAGGPQQVLGSIEHKRLGLDAADGTKSWRQSLKQRLGSLGGNPLEPGEHR
jgi:hypothetical protein